MSMIGLQASSRQAEGKGPARRLRQAGQIPAVAYGLGRSPLSLAVSPKELLEVLRSPKGRNSVVELDLGSEKVPTLLCDWQTHPVTRDILHADFLFIDVEQFVDVRVKLELTGKSVGVTMGGKLQQVYRTLPLRCRPLDAPVKLERDITALGVDEVVAVKDMELPEGVTISLPPEQTLVGVYADKRKREAADESEDAEKK